MSNILVERIEYTTNATQAPIELEREGANDNTSIAINVGGGATVTIQGTISPKIQSISRTWFNVTNLSAITSNTFGVLKDTPLKAIRAVTSGVVDAVILEVSEGLEDR